MRDRAVHAARQRRWAAANPGKVKRWRDANPTYGRKWKMTRKYGMSIAEYDALFVAQGGVCAICRCPETVKLSNGNVRPLAVDHDHKTDMVRGLLCDGCNRGLGCFRDDPARLEAAIEYLPASRTGTDRAINGHRVITSPHLDTESSWTDKPDYEPAPSVELNPWYSETASEQRDENGSSVYLIETGDHYKIGITKNVVSRLRNINRGVPTPAVLIAVRRGGRALEHRLHCALSAYRSQGEWFDKCDHVRETFLTLDKDTL